MEGEGFRSGRSLLFAVLGLGFRMKGFGGSGFIVIKVQIVVLVMVDDL